MATLRIDNCILIASLLVLLSVECSSIPSNYTKDLITLKQEVPKNQQTVSTTDRIETFFRSIIHRWVPSWIIDNLPPSLSNYIRGRCIGAMKRIQHTFIPLFFKLGVMTTTLTVLTVMTLKGLLIGLLLLFFHVTSFLAKFGGGKHHHDSDHYHPVIIPTPGWSASHHSGGWMPQPIVKNIHVHVHPPLGHQHQQEEHLLEHYGSYPSYIQRQDDLAKLLKVYREQTPTYALANSMNFATSGAISEETTNMNGLSPEDRKYIDKIISKLSS